MVCAKKNIGGVLVGWSGGRVRKTRRYPLTDHEADHEVVGSVPSHRPRGGRVCTKEKTKNPMSKGGGVSFKTRFLSGFEPFFRVFTTFFVAIVDFGKNLRTTFWVVLASGTMPGA